MKKLFCLLFILVSIISLSTAESIDEIKSAKENEVKTALNDFSLGMSKYVPNTTTQQNVWADAYIGKVFPSVPPHFGAGGTIGGSLMEIDKLEYLCNLIDLPISINFLPLPVVTAEARVGGLFLPFDFSVNVMKLDTVNLQAVSGNILIDFFTYGADIRIGIMEDKVILPAISIGAGYTHSEGTFSISEQESTTNIKTNARIGYKTDIFTISAQVSKNVLIATPYIGARAILQNGNYDWSTEFYINNQNTTLNGGIECTLQNAPIFQAYAGVGLNLFVIQTTVGACFDITNQIWSGSLSIHAKL